MWMRCKSQTQYKVWSVFKSLPFIHSSTTHHNKILSAENRGPTKFLMSRCSSEEKDHTPTTNQPGKGPKEWDLSISFSSSTLYPFTWRPSSDFYCLPHSPTHIGCWLGCETSERSIEHREPDTLAQWRTTTTRGNVAIRAAVTRYLGIYILSAEYERKEGVWRLCCVAIQKRGNALLQRFSNQERIGSSTCYVTLTEIRGEGGMFVFPFHSFTILCHFLTFPSLPRIEQILPEEIWQTSYFLIK